MTSSAMLTSSVGTGSGSLASSVTCTASPSSSSSSSSQYLHPDYIQPMPTSLDAKNSPLALLAQTCSSIGKDPTPPPSSSSSHRSSTSSAGDKKDAMHHHHKDSSAIDKIRPKSESPHSKRATAIDLAAGCDEHRSLSGGKSSSRDRGKDGGSSRPMVSAKGMSPPKSSSSSRTPFKDPASEQLSPTDLNGSGSRSGLLSRESGCGKPMAAVSGSSMSGKGLQPSMAGPMMDLSSESIHRFAVLQQQLSLAAAAAAAAAGRSPLYPHAALYAAASQLEQHGLGSSATPGAGPAGLYPPPPSIGCLSTPGFPGLLGHQFDPLQAYTASLQAASVAPLYAAEYAARLKAAATTCKDPYCIRCQLAATFQLPALGGPCCSSVNATSSVGSLPPTSTASPDKSGSSMAAAAAAAAAMMPPSLLPPYLPTASLHALLQHFSAASTGAPGAAVGSFADFQLPVGAAGTMLPPFYTCSWVDGAADFCGKRFATSDELLQHLRTHAAASSEPSSSSSAAAQPPHSAGGIGGTSCSSSSSSSSSSLLQQQSQGFHPHAAALAAAFSAAAAAYPPTATHAHQLSPLGGVGQTEPARSRSSYSPSALLAAAGSSRYHPYKPVSANSVFCTSAAAASVTSPSVLAMPIPTGGAPAGAASALGSAATAPLFPSLAAYYSPYAALYGQRFGAAAAVGP